MLGTIVQIDAYDPVAAAPVTLRIANCDDPSVCHLNGQTWWPAMSKAPTLRYDLFDGDFSGQIVSPSSTLTMQTELFPNFARYALADAVIQLWAGTVGEPWANWTLRFAGRITAQPTLQDFSASLSFGVDDKWLDKSFLATYAGTTGAEGPAAMKGQVKPLALGAPRYVPGKLIDSVNSVFQVSAYGAVQAFEAALERLVRFTAPVGDYASYAALVAAPVAAGRWASAAAIGMARFGAPPSGQISFLLQGDNSGTNGWARKPGQLIRRIALLAGGAGRIDEASLDALDLARPYNCSIYIDEQTTARSLIQSIAASVNAVAGVSWTGKLFVAPVGVVAPIATLAADGSALPPVKSVQQIEMAAPFSKLAMTAERAWSVHALTDVAFTAPLLPLGDYVATTSYREGNIVGLPDGSQWVYTATTATAGNLPATGSAFWSRRSVALAATYADGTPIDALKPAGPGSTRNDDGANMIPSPVLLDQVIVQSGATIEITTNKTGRPADYRRVVLNAAGANARWNGPVAVPCTPGETLWYADLVRAEGTGTDTCFVSVAFSKPDGTALSTLSLASQTTVNLTAVNGIWAKRIVNFVVPAGAATVQPYPQRGTYAQAFRFLVGEPYLARTQPGADITALNQATVTPVPDVVIAATYQGVIISGELPRTFSVRRMLGANDVSALTNYTVATQNGSNVTINNTAGSDQRGNVLITSVIGTSETLTITSTYLDFQIFTIVKVTVVNGAPPTSGGGGGGGGGTPGTPGSPSASSGPFTPPNTSISYVLAATLAAVTVGSNGQVDLSGSLSFYQQNDSGDGGEPGVPSSGQPTGLSLKWQASVNGGAFTDVTTQGSQTTAVNYFRSTKPYGQVNRAGSLSGTYTQSGLTSGASIVYRILTVASFSDYGVAPVTGTISATPK